MSEQLLQQRGINSIRKRPKGFQKGVSGNPLGRPKGSISLTDLLRQRLQKLAKDVPWAKAQIEKLGLNPDKATVANLFIDASLMAAIRGDGAAFNEVWNRIDGKIATEMTTGDGKLSIEVCYVGLKTNHGDDTN